MYRIVAIKRDGKAQTWEPVTGVFTDNPMPTANIRKRDDAIKEFNRSLNTVGADDYMSVKIGEKDKAGVWRDAIGKGIVPRFFKQDEREITSIDKEMFSMSLDMIMFSMRTNNLMQLSGISMESREQLRSLSHQIMDASDEVSRLKEKITEELYDKN